MAITKITELTTLQPESGDIENGKGLFIEGHTTFYWEDIKMVLDQNPAAPISNLEFVNVVFEREEDLKPKEVPGNHDIFEVSVLALRKPTKVIEEMNGEFDNRVAGGSKYYDIVALAWPPYYRRKSRDLSALPDSGSRYVNELYLGDDNYAPESFLNKRKRIIIKK